MSFQAYLDTIKEKTGMTPEDFRIEAEKKGLLGPDVKVAQLVEWITTDYPLGRGHAMAIVNTLGAAKGAGQSDEQKIDAQFSGTKAKWRPAYDLLLTRVREFGAVGTDPTNTYVSLTKNGKKFAIVAVTADRLDVGIKRRGTDAGGRFEAAGDWNSMVTHRVRITGPAQLDDELVEWLRAAYEAA
jgi:hypothetical protein